MLSSRGQAFAKSGLMAGYAREKDKPYNKLTNPEGEISFANAENFLMKEDVVTFINNNFKFDAKQCTYNEGPIGTRRLRAAMASHLNDYFSPFSLVTEDEVTFTTGITGLNEMLAFNLTDEGEAILLGRPIYGCFFDDLRQKSRSELVYASFGDIDQFSIDAVQAYENAILKAAKEGIKIKALLICNPHNPLGFCYPVETLRGLMQLCQKHNLHLISDEIYGLSVFEVEGSERTPFTSVLSIDPGGLLDVNRIHILYGMSKDFGAAGLRLGCIVTKNKEMTDATQAIGRYNWPSEVSCSIAASILENKSFVASYTSKSQTLLSQHYTLATKILDDAGIKYVGNGNAGFFLWIDLSPYLPSSEEAAANNEAAGWAAEKKLQKLIVDAGVPLAAGAAYQAERPGWFRILFTVDRDSLEESLKRIIDIVKRTG